jgi:hypothetical protein
MAFLMASTPLLNVYIYLLPLFTWEKGAAKIENKDSTKGLQAPQGNTSICAEIQLSKPKPTPETNL